jgi:hypothetical protein
MISGHKTYTITPEDNTFILLLLLLFSCGTYYFRWVAKVSTLFNENPVTNILLIVLTFGLWGLYLNMRYLDKSERLNDRRSSWYMVLFIFISPLIVQNNINEYFNSQK